MIGASGRCAACASMLAVSRASGCPLASRSLKAQLSAQQRVYEGEKRRLLHDKMMAECVATGQVPGTGKISLSQMRLTMAKVHADMQQSFDDEEDDAIDLPPLPLPPVNLLSPDSLQLESDVLKNLWQAQQHHNANAMQASAVIVFVTLSLYP